MSRRFIATQTPGVPFSVDIDRFHEVEGIRLMVHETPRIDPSAEPDPEKKWTCSEETTGYRVCFGAAAEEALWHAVTKITRHLEQARAEIAKHPVLNAPGKEAA